MKKDREPSLKTNRIKVSVIVPCYNVEKYIGRCLDSLIDQTLSEIEIICIDDKSTDETSEIIKKYMKTDNRIHLIEQPVNTGAAVARNAGIAAARGMYIGFVDADDYLDTNFYEKMYETALSSGADIIKSNAKITESDGTKRFDDMQMKRIQQHGKWYFLYQWWTGLFRADMIRHHKIQFPTEITCGQDIVFLTECVMHANQIALCPDVFYHYLRRSDSLDSPILSPQKITSKIAAIKKICAIYNKADMPDDIYIICYHQRWQLLKELFNRNTSVSCKKEVTAAFVDLYQQCKNAFKLIELYKKYMVSNCNHIPYIQSLDKEGLFDCFFVRKEQVPTVPGSRKFKINLFRLLPVLEISHEVKKTVVKFCKITLIKIKRKTDEYAVDVFYIPILKVKIK